MSEVKTIILHDNQKKAILSRARVICCVAGKQGGKSTVAMLWARMKSSSDFEPGDNAIVAAPTFKIFSQSTLPKFQEYFNGIGKWNKGEMSFQVNGRGKIFLRSMHEPDSAEGITSVKWIVADEAGKLKIRAYQNLVARSAFRESQIFLATTPYSMNWLYRDIYKPWSKGKLPDYEFLNWKSIDNPYFPKAEYERQKTLLDPKVFKLFYDGTFQQMEGLVYPDFNTEELNTEPPFTPSPESYFICAGLDFGYNNPLALSVRAIHKREKRDYQIAEIYKKFQNTDQMISIVRFIKEHFHVKTFYCDSADPQAIADLVSAGLPCYPVKKGPDSIVNGIRMHNALIKSREYKVLQGKCPNTEDEYSLYAYREYNEEGISPQSENPIDANNDLMDANRYVTVMTADFRRQRDELINKPIILSPGHTVANEDILVKDVYEEERGGDWSDDF